MISQEGTPGDIGSIGTPFCMGKPQPPGTVTHTIFLPTDLHRKVSAVAPDGKTADDVIVECVEEAMRERYKEWILNEAQKEGVDVSIAPKQVKKVQRS
jgi:hypothetical protein